MSHRPSPVAVVIAVGIGLPIVAVASAAGGPPALRLDLAGAVESALARNFTVASARLDPEVAEARRRIASGAFDPVLAASYVLGNDESPAFLDPLQTGTTGTLIETRRGTVSLSGLLPTGATWELAGRADGILQPGTSTATTYTTSAGIVLRQPLLAGSGPASALAPLRIARKDVELSTEALRGTVIDTITEVVLAFHDTVLAQEAHRASERSLALARKLLADNERRVELGALAPLDILQAQARLAFREDLLLQSARRLRDAERALLALVADLEDPAARPALELVAPPRPGRREPDATADFAVALEQRPDYRQAGLALDIARIEARRARADARPSLDAVASFGYRAQGAGFPATRRAVRDETDQYYSLGGVFSLPVGNRAARGESAAALLASRQQEIARRQLRQAILLELEAAADSVRTDWARIEAAGRARELAARALDAEERKLQAGTSTTFVVLQLQDDLTDAELRELVAVTDYFGSLAEYDRQVGLTLTRYGVDL